MLLHPDDRRLEGAHSVGAEVIEHPRVGAEEHPCGRRRLRVIEEGAPVRVAPGVFGRRLEADAQRADAVVLEQLVERELARLPHGAAEHAPSRVARRSLEVRS